MGDGGVRYSRKGIELAGKIVKRLEDNDGSAECFPYDEIEELKNEFWLWWTGWLTGLSVMPLGDSVGGFEGWCCYKTMKSQKMP